MTRDDMEAWLNTYGNYTSPHPNAPANMTGRWYSHNGIYIETNAEDPISNIYNRVKEGLYNHVCIVEDRGALLG